MAGGLNFRWPLGLSLSTIQGVTFVPQAWFVPVTSRSVSRAPAPWPARWKPRLLSRPPAWSPLNQPKKTPLEPAEAVRAKVPDADSLSFNVRVGILAAEYAGVEARQITPPISPFSLPAKFVGLYPNLCWTVFTVLGTTRLLWPSHPGSLSNRSALRIVF